MTTVAEIAAEAFTGVAAELTGVIKTCTITRPAGDSSYNSTSGAWEGGSTDITFTGRMLDGTAKSHKDVFGEYVLGPTEKMFWLEGLSQAPKEGDKITVGATEFQIKQVGDIVGAGEFFGVIVV